MAYIRGTAEVIYVFEERDRHQPSTAENVCLPERKQTLFADVISSCRNALFKTI